jgi:hypothetical protein
VEAESILQELTTNLARAEITIEIGAVPVRVHAADPSFLEMLENRYAGFVTRGGRSEFDFGIELVDPGSADADVDLRVTWDSGWWYLDRGDFAAELNLRSKRGRIRQSPNPYSIDAVLRILHTLLLAQEGGFLLHAASAIRNGKAFVFAGVSGAGKTTIASLAPPDATLLTDEISYVRKDGNQYAAFGTPFTGELGKPGENVCAPIAALYLLEKGSQNHIAPVTAAEASRAFLSNVLFFAEQRELVRSVFHSACEFVGRVPIYRLTFLPDSRVWEMLT